MLLVTGSNGQLGKTLSKLLPDALLTDYDTLDITDSKAVLAFVDTHHIDTIINCAAYTAVDLAEDNPEIATRINVDGPRNLAKSNAKIIHISTDYVFDGKHYKPYTENDLTNPQSVYGKTKLLGEQAILDNASTAVIIRTSWLYSSFGNNFVKTIQKLATEKDTLNIISDQIGTPTYADDLAKAIITILPKFITGKKDLYHFSNEGVSSWYDFAHEIIQQSNLNCAITPIASKDYPTKAIRPFYSVLDKSKIKTEFEITIPHWTESLYACLNQS